MSDGQTRITHEVDGHVALIGLDRPSKRNAFDGQMLRELSEAYTAFEEDDGQRCAVLFAHGDHFTAGLDLADVGPRVAGGAALFAADGVDPLGLGPRRRTKPVVACVQGWCLTIGIELLLASDIRVADTTTRFGQIEVKRGIFPFGGATLRWPRLTGWGDAMRYLLTGDLFDAEQARRMGLVQEVTAPGEQLELALGLARRVAAQAPLAVQATLRSAQQAGVEGFEAGAERLMAEARALFETEDAEEGLRSFLERREARFSGR